ncbi:MAG: sporulation protein YqfD [Bacilli bacterium]
MNRLFFNYLEGLVILEIKGKKIDRFLSYLYKMKVCLLQIKHVDRQHIEIKILKHDLEKIINMKTTYEINIIGYGGKLRLKEGIKKNCFLLLSLLIGYIFLTILSNIIFDVEVIHSNASIRNLIVDELSLHNIKVGYFKQSYDNIQKIKNEILTEYKDRIEWLEIESIGTKYIVKVEERKININQSNNTYQDIVATKNAVITKIEAITGEIVRHKNDYVKKGDILISGKIMKGSEVAKLVKADGKIYGEVWYNIKVEHTLIYQNKIKTGKKRDVYKIVFLNNSLSLLNFKPFTASISTFKTLVSNPLVPFMIVKEGQEEVIIEDEIYTDGEALIMAEEMATKKMEESLLEDEYIISKRKLRYYVEDQKLYLEMFFKVYESIGEPRAIME